MIQAFRGVGKSFLTCAYAVWRLWKNRDEKVFIISAGEDLATENATLIKAIIYADAGDGLWDDMRTPWGKRSSTLAFDVGGAKPDKTPSVKIGSITGQITGSRATILIPDDIEIPRNSATEAQREKLKKLTKEFADIVKPGEGEIVYLGTPQTEESIYKSLPERGYEVRVWPARYPTAQRMARYAGHLAPMIAADIEAKPELMKAMGSQAGGSPTEPLRHNELELQKKELEHGLPGFLLQYQLDTSLTDAERFPLKTRDLIVTDVDRSVAPMRLVWGSGPDQVIRDVANVGFDGDRLHRPVFLSPDYAPYTGSAMHVDPSGRGKDSTAYIVTKFLNGYVFIRAWGGFQDGYSEKTLETLAEIARAEEVNLVATEDNFGDGMFGKLLEPVLARKYPVQLDGYRVSGRKEERMMRLIRPALQQHRIVLDLTAAQKDVAHHDPHRRGLYQLTHLTEQKGALRHDDLIDVLAQALEYWAPQMNADADKAEERWKRKQDEEFERLHFAGTILGAEQARARRVHRGAGRRVGGRGRRWTG